MTDHRSRALDRWFSRKEQSFSAVPGSISSDGVPPDKGSRYPSQRPGKKCKQLPDLVNCISLLCMLMLDWEHEMQIEVLSTLRQ